MQHLLKICAKGILHIDMTRLIKKIFFGVYLIYSAMVVSGVQFIFIYVCV